MKNLARLLFFLVLAPLAMAVNTTIEGLSTTITLPRAADYIPASNGTTTARFLFSGLTFLTSTRTTLAALSVTTAVDGTGIVVLGASSAGDGGGATYYYNAASTQTPNGNTIIQPASLPFAGRWIKAVGGVGVPGVSTLGGIFSNAGATSKWVSSINTDGSVTLTQPAAGDISGLGTMASQSAGSVAITGGTLDGVTIGGTTLAPAGSFVSLTTNALFTVGGATIGNGAGNATIIVTGSGTSGFGSKIVFVRGGATIGYMGTDSGIFGGATSDIDVGANTGYNLRLFANGIQQGYVSSSGELNFGFGIFTKPIATFDSSSGGLYLGYGAGTSIIRSVADNSGTPSSISFITGSSTLAYMDSTGLVMQGSFKAQQATAPSAGIDLTNKTYVDSVAGSGSPKIINVRAYGAQGDGSHNDTTNINNAIAALGNGYTLYFPAGKYLITAGSLTNINSLTNLTICGDGRSSILYSTATTPAAAPFLVVAGACDMVTIRDFAIIGSATVRTSANHGLVVYSPHTLISSLYITGTGDFGIYVGSGGSLYNKNVQIVNCISDRTLGDGFHFGPVTDSGIYNCIAYYTNDDGVGIGDDGGIGFPATRIEVVGFQSIQAGNHAGGGNHGAGIRIFDGATDIHVIGGSIYQSCEAGITTGRFYTTNTYNTRIKIDGVKVYQCLQNTGMYANINFQWCNGLSVTGCWSEAPLSQGCYAFLDCSNVSFVGNTAKDAVLRAFVTDDGTTTNVASTWSNWVFANNVNLGAPSNETFYFVPATGKTISNLTLTGNVDLGGTAATYIATNRTGGVFKIGNNTSLGGKAIVFGGTGVTPTTFNNN